MVMEELCARRLVVLTGKGGVGKSLVGTALAVAAREAGRRVLFVEIQAPVSAARYLGAPPVGHEPVEVRPGLFMANLDPPATMEEFVRERIPLEMLVRRVLQSPVYHRFFAAAPGLKELILLGKIMVLTEALDRSRRPLYDLVVVDAPATGHGLAFLKVPQAASDAIPVGPVGHNARRVLALLRDPRRTAVVLVAVPEEMAVVEAIEFDRMARAELGVAPAAVVLNACHERRLPAADEAEVLRLLAAGARGPLGGAVDLSSALIAARRHIRRRKLTRFYRTRLERGVDVPIVALPYLFDETLGPEAVAELSRRLVAA